MIENAFNQFKEFILEIHKYKILRFIGYLTTPLIIGFFILKKINSKLLLLNTNKEKIILNLEDYIKNNLRKIEEDYQNFVKRDSYLIYSERNEFLTIINNLKGDLELILNQENFLSDRIIQFIKEIGSKLDDISKFFNQYNENFVKEKKLEYEDLFKRDNFELDHEQQTAVIVDDKHNLVVAGAGSGKTEVLTTRIAYLVKRKSDAIKPERILALAFQHKAANEIKDRIKKHYGIEVEIKTFHSLGNQILKDISIIKGDEAPKLKLECSEDWKFNKYIKNLFEKISTEDGLAQSDILKYLKNYTNRDIAMEEGDFTDKEEYYKYKQGLLHTTLDGNQTVKSEAERDIINFFFSHKLNGRPIEIQYEKPAEWMSYKNKDGEKCVPRPDFYFKNFDIYWEHWAVGHDNQFPTWFSGDNPKEKYLETMSIKKRKFYENNKTLIETNYSDSTSIQFDEIIKNKFIEALNKKFPDQKFEITPLSYVEIVQKIWKDHKSFVSIISDNIAKFIVIAKTYNLSPMDIDLRLKNGKWSPRQYSFGFVANKIYTIYQNDLFADNKIDFADMINLAVKELSQNKELYKNKYDHILIDEYQDVSTQRYNLIKELMSKNDGCKLFCVGDDWQSIMGFAGSNLSFFVEFDKYFDHPARTDLTKNYRSFKSIVDVGSAIIRHNTDRKLEKKTVANNEKELPIHIYSSLHHKDFHSKYYEQIAKHCIEKIKEYHQKGYSFGDFIILLRIAKKPKLRQFISEYAEALGVPICDEVDKPNCVRIMSVHKSKGLQSRIVIMLNVDQGLYGFPCELESPDIMLPAIKDNDGFRENEERRLFYVAVTRAKEEVIMYTQKCSESKFITEIKEFTKKDELGY